MDSTYAEVRVEVSMLSMCPTTSDRLPKQTPSMTVFLPQRLGLGSFLWAQAKSGEPQNGLAGCCRPSGQILTSLLRYALPPTSLALFIVPLGFNVDITR